MKSISESNKGNELGSQLMEELMDNITLSEDQEIDMSYTGIN